MNVSAETIEPEIIAFGFHDGATEGFALSIKDYGKCYFKMIAWDDDQDKRLYVISEIDTSVYSELVQILIRNRESSSAPVWIPKWQFENNIDKRDANNTVDACQKRLFLSKLLVLGEGINDGDSKVIEISDQVMHEVHKFLERNEPDDLANWLPKLNIK